MSFLKWILIVAGATALGIAVVRYPVVSPLEAGPCLFVCAGLAIGPLWLVAFHVRGRGRLDGYSREHISLAWMDFNEPAIGEAVRSLVGRDVEKRFVFATSISASSLHSLYDIPDAVTAAGIPAGVDVVNLGAWDDDPLVIRAIKERVDACRSEAP